LDSFKPIARWLIGLWLWLLTGFAQAEVLLANNWNERLDPSAYWVSEKLDGVRATWDGEQLHTRNGHLIHAPAWFIQGFPKQAMDGELWMGRKRFEEISGAVRQQAPNDGLWRQIHYRIFELPDTPGDFSARIIEMQRLSQAAAVPWLTPVEQFRIGTAAELRQKLDAVVASGGEGLMLHHADSSYHTGRSNALLKFKLFDDAEARVLAHISGTGRNANRLGALQVETAAGLRFRIGSGLSDLQRDNPPPIGALISYRYNGLTSKGLPRFPRFLRVRPEE
jgi:DNA ligase-1